MVSTLPLLHTSIGKKAVMAVTGLIGIGYAALHMLGNLKIFQGKEHFNAYAEFIRSVGEPVLPYGTFLWTLRIIMLGAVVLHIASAAMLTQQSHASRLVGYARQQRIAATFASRTMRWGGVMLVLFLVYHILHITTGTLHPRFEAGNVYANTVIGFSSWPVSLVYVVAMLIFGLHVYHGFWSLFQTLGANSRRVNRFLRGASVAVAGILTLGFISVPVAVLAGMLTL